MNVTDKKILKIIQERADISLQELARKVGLSRTPCWVRLRKMEEAGIIDKRVTLLNREKLGFPIVVFLSISISKQHPQWETRLKWILNHYDQITEAHRLTGTGADYLLKVVAASIEDYDRFQQELISRIDFTAMSSSVSLQELKSTTALPLGPNI